MLRGRAAVFPSADVGGNGTSSVVVTADFSKWADYPLSKAKFGVYNSGLVPLSHYDRDIDLFDEVKPNSLRIDLFWGGGEWSVPPVEGKPGDIRYHFGEMDHVAELLNSHHVQPLWNYCYIPPPLQAKAGDHRYVIANKTSWGEILAAFARHAKEAGPQGKVGYHEIYNEPDNRDFFRSSREDYFDLYREGSLGIREADPDAVIGGPALAFTPSWVAPFLKMIVQERLPLDFFSFHFYPGCWKTNTVGDVIQYMRGELAKQPALATTEMYLDEYNTYPIDYPAGGRQDRYPIAAAMLEDYERFLSQPDLAQVNWAQFQEPGNGDCSGMISADGHRKALFNAAATYARMPEDRKEVLFKGANGLNGMASADDRRASVVIWNRSGGDRYITASLAHTPFERANFQVYRIDADHSSWGDNPLHEKLIPTETKLGISTRGLQWKGMVPKDGVIYFELNNDAGKENAQSVIAPKVVRVLHYYPDRASHAYADFDRSQWAAWLGMATERKAQQQIGVVAEGLPVRLLVHVQTEGRLHKIDENSLLGMRLDYGVGTNYVRSILFHGPSEKWPDLSDPRRNAPVPWGTKLQADRMIRVPDFSCFQVAPAEEAPPGWNGRIQITFLMQNSGKGTKAKFTLKAE
jgi:hypothetical protein